MKTHIKGRAGQIVMTTVLFLLLSILALWSWNTLADLFAWPNAQYKHILAALGLLLVIRFGLFSSHRHGHMIKESRE